MKSSVNLALATAALAFAGAGSLHAAHVIDAANLVYTQNFDALPPPGAAAITWTNDSTIPEWWLHRSSSIAAITMGASDGTGTWAAGIYSLGAAAGPEAADRSLGSAPSSSAPAGTHQSYVLVLQNGSTKPIRIANLSFNGETYRANSVANVPEDLQFYVRKEAATEAAITATLAPATAAALPAADWTEYTGFKYTTPAGNTASQVYNPANTQTVSGEPAPFVVIGAGKFFALRWYNSNSANSDAYIGLDDLTVTFAEIDCAVTPTVSAIVRNDNGTPRIPGDDTVSFTLKVAATGTFSPTGWKISAADDPLLVNQAGAYDTDVALTAPISAFDPTTHAMALTVRDAADQYCFATASVALTAAQWCAITATASDFTHNNGGTPNDLADDTYSYKITADGTWTGTDFTVTPGVGLTAAYGNSVSVTGVSLTAATHNVTVTDSADANCKVTVTISPPAVVGIDRTTGVDNNIFCAGRGGTPGWVTNNAARTLTQKQGENPTGSGPASGFVVNSETVSLAGVTGAVRFTAELAVNETSTGSNFEDDDIFKAELIIDEGLGTQQTVNLIAPFDRNQSAPAFTGVMNGFTAANAAAYDAAKANDDFNKAANHTAAEAAWTDTFQLRTYIPDSATTARLVVTGINDSAGETFTLQNAVFEVSPPSVLVALHEPITVDNKGTANPADDEFSAKLDIAGINLGASTAWDSNSVPAAGNYTDPNPITFGPFPVSGGAKLITISDHLNPVISGSINLVPPAPSLVVSAPANVTRVKNGFGAADDTLTFEVTITGANGGPAWATSTPDVSPPGGTFGLKTLTISPYPTTGPVSVTFTDVSYPAATQTVSVALPPPPAVTVDAPANLIRVENGPGIADDTATFDLNVTGTGGGTGWTATGATPVAGVYGPVSFSLSNLTTAAMPVVISDDEYPTATATVNVTPPRRYVIGQTNFGAGTGELLTPLALLPDTQWANDPSLRTLTMVNAATVDRTVTSDPVDLSGVAGDVNFTAQLIASDSSTGSNFETADTFVARLILDEGLASEQIVNLITPFDADNNGKLNGFNGAAYDPNLDEFNVGRQPASASMTHTFTLSHLIPDTVVTAKLVIVGQCGAAASSENFVVQNVLFATGPVDSDGDGMTDDYEDANGLAKNDPADKNLDLDGDGQTNYQEFLAGNAANNAASLLRSTSTSIDKATGSYSITWDSVAGKKYRVQHSPDPSAPWADASPADITATGASTSDSGTLPLPLGDHHFLRVRVIP